MKTVEWHKIAAHENELQFNTHGLAITTINSKTVTLAKYNNQLFACAHKCPHASGIMANGFITSNGHIVCPLHRYQFNLYNGRNTTGEGYFLKTYPIKKEMDGSIFIGFERKGLFEW